MRAATSCFILCLLYSGTYPSRLFVPAELYHSAESIAGGNVDYSCGAASDALVQALERVKPDSEEATVLDALQLIKTSTDLCSQFGDAWYYRSLFEQRLKHAEKAEFARSQAARFGSEALNEHADPFTLATPRSPANSVEANAFKEGLLSASSRKWALVVGISRFQDDKIHPLQYTTHDADEFARTLMDPAIGGFTSDNVLRLTDSEATVRNIKAKLNWIARNAAPQDIVVIYVATHGSPRRHDSVSGINYLVAFDTEMYPSGNFNEDSLYATAFPMVELANAVSTRMRSMHTLVVLDTCYSGASFAPLPQAGAVAGSAAPQPEMLERFSAGSGRMVMAASQSNEVSHESNSLKHGFFTYYLLQALRQSSGKQPLGKLFATVSANVAGEADRLGEKQHPVLYKSNAAADFALNGTGDAH